MCTGDNTQSENIVTEHSNALYGIAECCESKDTSCHTMESTVEESEVAVSGSERVTTARGVAMETPLLRNAQLDVSTNMCHMQVEISDAGEPKKFGICDKFLGIGTVFLLDVVNGSQVLNLEILMATHEVMSKWHLNVWNTSVRGPAELYQLVTTGGAISNYQSCNTE